jgi:hypothetical protein
MSSERGNPLGLQRTMIRKITSKLGVTRVSVCRPE